MIGDPRAVPVSREHFLQNLKDSSLSGADDLLRMLASPTEPGEADGETLARQLVRGGHLTGYQARALLEGRLADLRIGAYELLDLLGQGAMGTVYEARHRTMKRTVAIKVLAPEVAKDAPFAQRFRREVETLAQLSHVNIIMAYDAGESPAGHFLAMEFVQGRDLARQVKDEGPLSVADALDCTLQAARGLQYAHEQGLIHRDIKPANLMRDARGVVKVSDLGLARIRNPQLAESQRALTQTGGFVGTVDYMAPEQAVDSSTVDHRADIYSLGCTLFYLLTGQPMYSGSSLMSLLLQHRESPPPSLRKARPDVPDIVEAVYLRMVAKLPADRYASMTQVVVALEVAARSLSAVGLFPSIPGEAPRAGPSWAENTMEFAPGRSTDHASEGKAPPRTEIGETPAPPSPEECSSGPLPAPATQPGPIAPAAEVQSPGPPPTRRASQSSRGVLLTAAALGGVLVLGGWIWWQFLRSAPGTGQPATNRAPADLAAKAGPFTGTILSGGGSTFINPLMQYWAGVYEKTHHLRIDYQAVGSGRGIDGFFHRVYRFGCSDAPLTDEQIAKAGGDVVHVPLVLGAVVPAYNLPGVATGQLRFTGPILADIYLAKITNWRDPAIKIANPGIELPDLPITPVHRSDASGTTFIWTDYLSTVSGEWKSKFGATMLPQWPSGLAGKGNHAVANQISRTVGSIGYLELSYALENNLRFGQVKNRDGRFITPTLESLTAAADALTDIPSDLRLRLIDGAGEETYPIVGLVYALIRTNQVGNPSSRELVAFLRWATHEGQAYVKELHYAPLPPELVQRIDAALGSVAVGSSSQQ
jgi:phosphate ABC transporter phosphate-binding protein